jgi:hypothetical protein
MNENEMLSKLSGSEFIGLVCVVVLFGGGVLVALILGLTGILTSHRRGVRQLELEMSLKQQMVAKGMSAEDIERVMRAGPGAPQTAAASPPAATTPLNEMSPRQLDVRVATDLANAGMEGERLQQAVGAVAAADVDTKRAVAEAVAAMIDNGADEEQMHAAVMGLCQPPAQGIRKLTLG